MYDMWNVNRILSVKHYTHTTCNDIALFFFCFCSAGTKNVDAVLCFLAPTLCVFTDFPFFICVCLEADSIQSIFIHVL